MCPSSEFIGAVYRTEGFSNMFVIYSDVLSSFCFVIGWSLP